MLRRRGNSYFVRQRVDVEVLPSHRHERLAADNIDKHVAEVRNQFLRVLKQEEQSTPAQDQPQTQIEPEIDTDDDSSH